MDKNDLYQSIRENIQYVGERDCADKILPALERIIRNMAFDIPIENEDLITLNKYLPIYSDGARIHEIIRKGLKR